MTTTDSNSSSRGRARLVARVFTSLAVGATVVVASATFGPHAGAQVPVGIPGTGRTAPVPGGHPVGGAVDTQSLPGVNLDSLDRRPIDQWGVVGVAAHTGGVFSSVWDMAEINGVIYVGGGFTAVQKGYNQPAQPQSFLAAFDRDSGEWLSTFRPTFNRPVLALQVSSTGKLLVGGEFTTVNGQARKGLVAIDPATGAIDPAFAATVDGSEPVVRELVRSGSTLYVGGVFSRIYGSPGQPWMWNAGRVNDTTGRLDYGWTPKFMGGVWDLTIDGPRNRVAAVGSFTSIDGLNGTRNMGAVSGTTGAVITGLAPYTYNRTNETQRNTVGITYANNRLYVLGEQHSVQVLDAATHQRIGHMNTGYPTCNTFNVTGCPVSAGGAYQVAERTADGKIFTGCHCWEPYLNSTALWSIPTYYNSFDNQRWFLYGAQALRASDSKVASLFVPGLRKATAMETWNLFVDSRGCYYVGGYYSAKFDGTWLGGFGRMCEPVASVTGLAATGTPGTATLTWAHSNNQLPVASYEIVRNGAVVGSSTTTSFAATGLAAGSHTFGVRTVDVSGRRSATVTVTVTVPATVVDDQPPTAPPNVQAIVGADGRVTITWDAATDLPNPGGVGVSRYYVVRDWTTQFPVLATAPRQYVDQPPAGTRRYQVFAVDRNGRIGPGSTAVRVTVPPPA